MITTVALLWILFGSTVAANLIITFILLLLHNVTDSMYIFGLWLSNGQQTVYHQPDDAINDQRQLINALKAGAGVTLIIQGLAIAGDISLILNSMPPLCSLTYLLTICSVAVGIAVIIQRKIRDTYADMTGQWQRIGELRRSYAADESPTTVAQVKRNNKAKTQSQLYVTNRKTKKVEIPTRKIIR
jgi:hypothetical protein